MNCKLTEFSSPVENEVHVDSCQIDPAIRVADHIGDDSGNIQISFTPNLDPVWIVMDGRELAGGSENSESQGNTGLGGRNALGENECTPVP
jgi:hypothetical protein